MISNDQSSLELAGRFSRPARLSSLAKMISERQLRLCNLCIEIQPSDRRRAPWSARPVAADNSLRRGLLAVFSSSPIVRSSAIYLFLRRGKTFPYWSTFCIVFHMSELERIAAVWWTFSSCDFDVTLSKLYTPWTFSHHTFLHRLRVSSRFSFCLFYRIFMGSCHRSLGRFIEVDIFDID